MPRSKFHFFAGNGRGAGRFKICRFLWVHVDSCRHPETSADFCRCLQISADIPRSAVLLCRFLQVPADFCGHPQICSFVWTDQGLVGALKICRFPQMLQISADIHRPLQLSTNTRRFLQIFADFLKTAVFCRHPKSFLCRLQWHGAGRFEVCRFLWMPADSCRHPQRLLQISAGFCRFLQVPADFHMHPQQICSFAWTDQGLAHSRPADFCRCCRFLQTPADFCRHPRPPQLSTNTHRFLQTSADFLRSAVFRRHPQSFLHRCQPVAQGWQI